MDFTANEGSGLTRPGVQIPPSPPVEQHKTPEFLRKLGGFGFRQSCLVLMLLLYPAPFFV